MPKTKSLKQSIAYSKIVIKSFDDDLREFVGLATSITPDRHDDIVESKGAVFELPMPLLWQHDHDDPVGEVYKAEVTDEGIVVHCRLMSVDEPPRLRERLNEAWAKVKTGLVKGLSVGFNAIEYSYIDGGYGIKFTKWDWYELSLVTVPANIDANISVIRQYAKKATPASGKQVKSVTKKPVYLNTGVTVKNNDGANPMFKKQIENFKAKRLALIQERSELAKAAADEGRTFTAEEQEGFDSIDAEIKSIDDHVKRLESLVQDDAATAEPVTKSQATTAAKPREPHIVVAPNNAEKGVAFAQYVRMLGLAKGNTMYAADLAKSAGSSIDQRVLGAFKAAVPAANTQDPNWAGNLVHQGGIVADFVEFLRPQTIIGRFGSDSIPALRNVPADVPIDIQTSGGNAQWTGEGKAKPLTKWSYDKTKLSEYKIAAIAAVTQELLRKSTASADVLLRDELANSIIERMDTDFIDPTKAAVAGISPASITNGATTQASVDIDTDITFLFGVLMGGKIPLTSGVLVMSASNAFALSRKRDALGNRLYPDLSITGGQIEGMPVIVSDYAGTTVALLAAREIWLVDEGGLQVDYSDQASLEMSDAPTGDSTTPTATQLVSLWQTNSVAFRAERFINWQRRRQQAVAYVTGANYAVEPEEPAGP